MVVRQPQKPSTLGQHWGSAVEARRSQLGLSQAQLATLAGITQQTVSKIEAGRMIPHDRLKLVLANRLGTEPGALFAWPPKSSLTEAA